MCSIMCNAMCASRLGVLRRFTGLKTTNIHSPSYANIGKNPSSFISERNMTKLCRFHSQVNHFYRELHLSSISFYSEIPISKLKVRNNADKFGDLSGESSAELVNDEGDAIEDKFITYPVPAQQRLSNKQYADIIKKHVEDKKLAAAVDVLETRMLKEDRVKPNAYIYSLLISACGRFGESRKAFKLYNGMKQRALKIPGAVYTALFNACANSHDYHDGLKRAIKLHSELVAKNVELNSTHYHAMIKAYGHCGDLGRAFEVADIMIDKEMKMDEQTFNFLLQACITDKKAGFRHALRVWHKMLEKNVDPTIYSFNLMLRCVRDCELGKCEEVENILQQFIFDYGTPLKASIHFDARYLAIADGSPTESVTSSLQNNAMVNPSQFLPDLLSRAPVLRCDVSSLDLTKPHERLLLLGGCRGVLKYMANFKVQPGIKTYTLLIDCLPPTTAAENFLVTKMRKDGIPIDIEFCNALIKKRSFRFDYSGAETVLELIREEKLLPDIITFGVLALSCTTVEEAKLLVRNMRQAGFRMNVEILGAMLRQGCSRRDFKYIMKVLYLTKEESIKPSPLFMENIQNLIASSRELLKQKGGGDDVVPLTFKKEFTTFMCKYEAWLKEINELENNPHTGTQYSQQY